MKRNNSSDDFTVAGNQEDIKRQDNSIWIDEKDIAVIIKTGGSDKSPVPIILLPFLAMLLSMLPEISKLAFNLETARFGIIALLLTGIVVFYIRFNLSGLYTKKLFMPIFVLGYLGSLVLLLYVPSPEIFTFWMLGGIVIAMLFDQRLGLLIHFAYTVFMGICFLDSPKAIIQIMFIGVLTIMLSGALKQKATAVYASIIILSTNITVAFILNNFIFRMLNGFNYMISLFSLLIVLTAAFFINYIYNTKYALAAESSGNTAAKADKDDGQADGLQINSDDNINAGLNQEVSKADQAESIIIQSVNYADQTDESDSRTDAESSIKDVTGLQTESSLELLCDKSNLLLVQLKQYSEALYAHSEKIADLAFRAALEIGADAKLALAGGLYHEIGRIKNSGNYIEDGLAIADEYKFPAELKAIIKEHNIKYGKPGSLEACLVMLADSLEASISYVLKNKGNKYSTEKIIDSVFKLRMDKGIFDACPLKIKDYKRLKEFFIREYADYKIN